MHHLQVKPFVRVPGSKAILEHKKLSHLCYIAVLIIDCVVFVYLYTCISYGQLTGLFTKDTHGQFSDFIPKGPHRPVLLLHFQYPHFSTKSKPNSYKCRCPYGSHMERDVGQHKLNMFPKLHA